MVFNKEQWTSKSPIAREVPLEIHWYDKPETMPTETLPDYVSEVQEPFLLN